MGGETHVRDVIELSQTLHHHIADFLVGDLDSALSVEGRLDILYQGVDRGGAYRQLRAGAADAGAHLLTGELLAAPILFHNHDRGDLDTLVGGESATAVKAFTTAANTIVGLTRVGDLGIGVLAERTAHLIRYRETTLPRVFMCAAALLSISPPGEPEILPRIYEARGEYPYILRLSMQPSTRFSAFSALYG